MTIPQTQLFSIDSQQNSFFAEKLVPKDILIEIFSKTDLGDIIKLPQVCKSFYKIMKEQVLWTEIARRVNWLIKEITVKETNPIQLIKREFIEVTRAIKCLLKNENRSVINAIIDHLPPDIKAILDRTTAFSADNRVNENIPTFDEIKLLKDYLKARDTIVVWQALSSALWRAFSSNDKTTYFPKKEYSKRESARQIIDFANSFSEWFEQNKDYLVTLKELSLHCRKLSTLPEEIGQLTQVKRLYLYENQLVTIPTQIKKLSQLDLLDLRQNSFSTISSEIGQLTQLRELILRLNRLSTLPAEIGQMNQLQELDLSGNNFSILPSEIGQLTQVQRLRLFQNNISFLPPEIGQLTQLQELELSQNNISSLPSEIGQLTQLQELNLQFNQLQFLPVEIGQLIQLRELLLLQNNLSSLPPEISQLTQLQKLNLAQNKLSILPPELYRIPSLSISHNPLSFMNDVNYFIYTHGKNLFGIAAATTLTSLAYFYPTQIATGLPYVGAVIGAVAIQKLVHRYFQ